MIFPCFAVVYLPRQLLINLAGPLGSSAWLIGLVGWLGWLAWPVGAGRGLVP